MRARCHFAKKAGGDLEKIRAIPLTRRKPGSKKEEPAAVHRTMHARFCSGRFTTAY
jgi:hypothetical protein